MKKTEKIIGAAVLIILAAALLTGAAAASDTYDRQQDLPSDISSALNTEPTVKLYADEACQTEITIEIPLAAGRDFWVKITGAAPYQHLALSDSTGIWGYDNQDGVSKQIIGNFIYNQNVFFADSSGEAKIRFKSYDLGGTSVGVILLKDNGTFAKPEWTQQSVTDLPIAGRSVSGGPADVRMAYHYYEEEELPPGRYYRVENGKVTTYYVDTRSEFVEEEEQEMTYLAPSAHNKEGTYIDAKGTVSFIMINPTINTSAQVDFRPPETPHEAPSEYIYDLRGASFVLDNDDTYIISGTVSVPGADDDDDDDENDLDLENIGFELVDSTGFATKISPIYFNHGRFYFLPDAFDRFKTGKYTLRLYFEEDDDDSLIVPGTPAAFLTGDEIPVTFIRESDITLTLSAEEAVSGSSFRGEFNGLPGHKYIVTTANGILIPDQRNVTVSADKKSAEVRMPASGLFKISLKADLASGLKSVDASVTVQDTREAKSRVRNHDTAEITILNAVLTAQTDKASFIIGDDIHISGTNSSDEELRFFIEGTNVPFTLINKASGSSLTATPGDWNVTIRYADLKESAGSDLDTGTYTVYVAPESDKYDKKTVTAGVYETVPLTLKQAAITLTEVPETAVQGEKITIKGTADAAKSVIWYLFGTNCFEAGVQKVKDDKFTITIDKECTASDRMAAGQYFLVVQHPMYDGLYSIAPEKMQGWDSGENSMTKIDPETGKPYVLKNILKSDKDGVYKASLPLTATGAVPSVIFDTSSRQTANAAQALCDALDSQNFDDMYAKASFIVSAPISIINPIPAKIVQGEKLTISGTTTGHVGDAVTVDLISTVFIAVPKEAAGTAAFITRTTKVLDDGTWSVEFDTFNLNCDDYTVSVSLGQLGPVTAKLTVTEKQVTSIVKPTLRPTQQLPVVPTTAAPTQTPSTPGFGTLAALAGLGAAAVLLLRRE